MKVQDVTITDEFSEFVQIGIIVKDMEKTKKPCLTFLV